MGETLRIPALDRRQMAIAASAGVVLWLAAALLLRWLGPLGIYDGGTRVLLYSLVIPGTYPFLLAIGWLARLDRGQMVQAIALGTGVATVLDGTALAWFPGLYGDSVAMHAGAGGTVLWGAGVGLLLAFWIDRPR